MKNKLLTFAGALALLAVIGRFYAQPLMAQVRAALVQSVDEPGRNPYQQTVLFSQAGCTIFTCTVQFNPVPAGFRLVITYVSATYTLNLGGAHADATLTNGVVNNIGFLLGLNLQPTNHDLNEYTVSSPVTYYVGQGQTPTLLLSGVQMSNAALSQTATIVGHLVAVP